ncbi:MAG: aminotransferase class V-fold PLP-dependent enzyme [Candidatus Korobacteraceae bacterium]
MRTVLMTPTPPTTASPIETARDLFEIPEGITYLNCASMAPQLRSVTEAGLRAVRTKASPWNLSGPEWFSGSEELRALAARVMGTDGDGVALVPAASYGIATAAANLPLARGQTIVMLHQQFPSNVYAWYELAKKNGGRVVAVQREPSVDWTEALIAAIGENTAIVAVPQCHWTDGSRVDLGRVGQRAQDVGAGLVIDASQSLGASPLSLERVQPDFLTAVGYKWLLGPYGLGYLYVAPKWRESGVPLEQSWIARAGSDDFSRLVDHTDAYRPGARRFDMGESPQFVLAPMAIAALQQILAWGVERIQQTLSLLTEKVAQLAADIDYSVLPREQRSAHMIGIRHARGIPAGLSQLLHDANVFVSVRGDSIRIAPHLYNDAGDIERLFAVLRKASGR